MEPTAIADILDRFNTETEWGSIKAGAPGPDDEGPWVRPGDAADPAVARRLAEHYAGNDNRTEPLTVIGNYAFRELCYMPLLIQGAVFALHGRVLALQDNLLVREFEYFQHWRLLEPRTLPPSSSREATIDALFTEVRRAYQPIVEGFRAERFVAPANAWGSLLDSLADGFWQAGKQGVGMDAAWALWESTIAGRSFPTRRRPRRHQFEVPGAQPDDISIRAGCCLWYTTEEARERPDLKHCYSCYLTTDDERIAWRTAHPRDEHEEEENKEESA